MLPVLRINCGQLWYGVTSGMNLCHTWRHVVLIFLAFGITWNPHLLSFIKYWPASYNLPRKWESPQPKPESLCNGIDSFSCRSIFFFRHLKVNLHGLLINKYRLIFFKCCSWIIDKNGGPGPGIFWEFWHDVDTGKDPRVLLKWPAWPCKYMQTFRSSCNFRWE